MVLSLGDQLFQRCDFLIRVALCRFGSTFGLIRFLLKPPSFRPSPERFRLQIIAKASQFRDFVARGFPVRFHEISSLACVRVHVCADARSFILPSPKGEGSEILS